VDEAVDLVVAKHPSETEEHCLMRLLAWGLFWQPGIRMAGSVCQGDEPDLQVEQHGIIVGINNQKRIRKAAVRHPRLTCLEWRPRFIRSASELCQRINRDGATATIIGVEGELNGLLASVQRRNNWMLELTDHDFVVDTGKNKFEFSTQTLCRL